MVTYDAGLISVLLRACEETKVVKAGFFFTLTNLLTHRKIKIKTLFGDSLRMCGFAWLLLLAYAISN